MILIVGLGNPGPKYENTRHNIGFMVIDELARKFQISNFKFQSDKKSKSEILKCHFAGQDLLLVKPQTMMNASGYTVKSLTTTYNIQQSNLWIIHDDLDLNLGKLKISAGQRSAGHHGIDSIVEQLNTQDFIRFRVGIGRPTKEERQEKKYEIIDYVLRNFSGKEAVEANKAIKKTTVAVITTLEKGIEKAANQYNP